MQDNNNSYGDLIKSVRQEQDLTQKELADRLDVGQKYVSKLELEQTNPTVDQLRRVFDALDYPSPV